MKKLKEQLYFYKIVRIIRIIDGDTFECVLDLGFNTYKQTIVRLLNFDAIEIRHTKKLHNQSEDKNIAPDLLIEIGNLMKKELEQLLSKADDKYIKSEKLDSFGRALGTLYINGYEVNELLKLKQNKLLQEHKGGN